MFNFIKDRIAKIQGKSQGVKNVYINTMGTACTNKCYMCPLRTQKVRNTKMPDEVFKKIIHQLKDVNFSGELHLYGQDEPFLDKDIISKVNFAKKELPNAKIILISNFVVLSEEKIKEVLKAPLTYFSYSIYALKRENYKQICGRDNFKLSFTNHVKFLKEFAKTEPFSFCMYLMNNKYNQDDIEFCKYFFQDIVPASLVKLNETYAFFNTNFMPIKRHKGFINNCIYEEFMFTNNGDIGICPCDASNQLKIGNINENNNHITNLINCKTAVSLRKKMFENKSEDAYCRHCDYGKYESKLLYFLPIPEKLRIFLNKHFVKSYKNDYAAIKFNEEEIKERLAKFNEIFKDNEEDKWLDSLENLRKDFYETKFKTFKSTWGKNVKVKG